MNTYNESNLLNVLIVDDVFYNIKALSALLSKYKCFNIHHALNG